MKRSSGAESEETVEDSPPAPKVLKRVDEETMEDGEIREDEESETPIDPTRIVITVRREEEPVPPSAANDVVQKVVKLEDFQRACRMAQEAQERVDFLENLLDKKPSINESKASEVDELQIRITCLTQQLKAERSKAKENELKFTQQLEVEKSRLIEERKRVCARMDELTRAHSAEVRKNHDEKMKDRASIRALKEQLEAFEKSKANEQPSNDSILVAALLKKATSLTQQLAAERTKLNKQGARKNEQERKHADELCRIKEGRKKDQARIDELTRKLAQCQSEQQPKGDLHDPREKNGGQSTNILHVCSSSRTKTISYESAAKQLKTLYDHRHGNWMMGFGKMALECTLCHTMPMKSPGVLNHFFSEGHATRFRKHNAEVSMAAFEFWLRNLKKVSDYKEPVVCDAAPSEDDEEDTVDEEISEDEEEKEETDDEEDEDEEETDEEEEHMQEEKVDQGDSAPAPAAPTDEEESDEDEDEEEEEEDSDEDEEEEVKEAKTSRPADSFIKLRSSGEMDD